MPSMNIDRLYAGKKYRLDINSQDAEGKTINLPFIDISVPPAISKNDLLELVSDAPTPTNDAVSFRLPEIPQTTVPRTASFYLVNKVNYTQSTKTTDTAVSAIDITTYSGSYTGGQLEWTSIKANSTAQISYSGSTMQATFTSVPTISANNEITVSLSISASAKGKTVKVKGTNDTITRNEVPFNLKATGKFSPIRNIDGTAAKPKTAFDSGVMVVTKDTIFQAVPADPIAADAQYLFKFNGTSKQILADTDTVKDIIVPIWRYTTSSVISKWFYCSIKSYNGTDSYYIPSTASQSGTEYIVDESNYYPLTSTPRTTTKRYIGYDSTRTSASVGQPTASATDYNIISDSERIFGPELAAYVYLYEGYSKNYTYPILIWDIAFAIVRYVKVSGTWQAQKWMNADNDSTLLNISKIYRVTKNSNEIRPPEPMIILNPIAIKFDEITGVQVA